VGVCVCVRMLPDRLYLLVTYAVVALFVSYARFSVVTILCSQVNVSLVMIAFHFGTFCFSF